MGQCPQLQRDFSNIGSAYIDELADKAVFGDFFNISQGEFVNDGKLYFLGNIENNGYLGDGFGYEYIKSCDQSSTVISGNGSTEFNILEIENPGNVLLQKEIKLRTNLQFNSGYVQTDRANPNHRVLFREGASHRSANDDRHINGTVAKQGQGSFIFPLGDGHHMSPMQLRGVNPFDVFTATYYSTELETDVFEQPGQFSVDSTDFDVLQVQESEFWTVTGSHSTRLTLFFTTFSNIYNLTSNISDLIVVGWDGAKWVNLGHTDYIEVFGTGTLTSENLIPDRYQAFTFGVLDTDGDKIADSSDEDPFDPCNPDLFGLACSERICVEVSAAVWLEGALQAGRVGEYGDEMKTQLMYYGYLPGMKPRTLFGIATEAGQPYDIEPWNYGGNEGEEIDEFVENGEAYPEGVVDWVLVSLRTTEFAESEVCRKSALLLKSGELLFTEYFDCCGLVEQEYYIVLEHRNHLPVMTPFPIAVDDGKLFFDFRVNQSYMRLLGDGQKEIREGEFAMYAGNGDQMLSAESSRDINSNDVGVWAQDNGKHSGYYFRDFDLNGDVNVHDKALLLENNGVFTDVDM